MNLPKHGNLFFNKNTGELTKIGGNIGNSILNNCAERLYAKIDGDKSNDAYIYLEWTVNGSLIEKELPKFQTLTPTAQYNIRKSIHKAINLSLV